MRDEQGFTLIEMVITTVVLSIIVTAVYGLFGTLKSSNAAANNLTIATQIVQQQMETYRNTPYNLITVGTTNLTPALSGYPSLGSGSSASAIVTVTDPNGIKQIEVDVNYFDRKIPKSVKLVTAMSDNGLNR